jgi:hypothetical protein
VEEGRGEGKDGATASGFVGVALARDRGFGDSGLSIPRVQRRTVQTDSQNIQYPIELLAGPAGSPAPIRRGR